MLTQPCAGHILSCHLAPHLCKKHLEYFLMYFSFEILLSIFVFPQFFIQVLVTDVQRCRLGGAVPSASPAVCWPCGAEEQGSLWDGSKTSSTKLLNLINFRLSTAKTEDCSVVSEAEIIFCIYVECDIRYDISMTLCINEHLKPC